MKLTRRGYGVLGVVVLAEALAITYGARALNAIAAPAVVVLLASAVQLWRTSAPTGERDRVPASFPGDTREVTVDVDGGGVAEIDETVPEGLDAEGASAEASLPTTFAYSLTCVERGRHKLGPLTVRVRDMLGLVERTTQAGSTTRVLVYPPVYQVAGRQAILQHVLDRSEVERQEFDSIREYAPGDPLRDVHWKSTAKSPDEIYVTEFADNRVEDDDITIAAVGDAGSIDEMAAAAASVAVMALDAGLAVELRLPDAHVRLGRGDHHRQRLLATLAETDTDFTSPFQTYTLDDDVLADADVVVRSDSDGVTLAFGTDERDFEAVTASRENPLSARGVGS
ncbi:hypothetical protein C475_01636 [Halosimplex carlsbadense 2-9-1]|uniref:Uncharacterized protein n=1 Tax=Halosimplex carlsbadense 2-9-1 TaxID=797114 RepID=M0D2E2_9EURY|nr:DUF58 domain-containing protein [Halosimplex carlsbadense]ELZ29610.1 hypothetical protein C475_01636 [Halosimplex carlsbadense 2-9-1]